MYLKSRVSMCVICVLLYLTRTTKSNKNGWNRKKQLEKTLFNLHEYHGDDRNNEKEENKYANFINQTDKLLQETKRNLILSFGLRKNMVLHNEEVRRRKPHNYMLYITEMYKNLTMNGLHSLRHSERGCGGLGLGIPLPSLVNTVRGCADIGGTYGKLADFPHISFKFDISEIPQSETLITSKLKILMQPPKTLQKRSTFKTASMKHFYKITLYIVLPRAQNSRSHFPRLLEVKSKRLEIVDGQESRWICFDTSTFVYGTLSKRYIKFVMRVQALGGGSALEPKILGFFKHDIEDTKNALLVLFTGDKQETELQNLRKKRGVHVSSKPPKQEHRRRKKGKRKKRKKHKKNRRHRRKKQCRKKDMIVNFESFQWTNWLVEPREYNAYHCHGLCKYIIPKHLSSSNHAIIQSMVHSKNKKFVPAPCCVPAEFKALYLLSLDGPDRVVLKKKEGLIATKCVCK